VLRWAAVWGIALVALSVIISKFTVLLMSIIVSAPVWKSTVEDDACRKILTVIS